MIGSRVGCVAGDEDEIGEIDGQFDFAGVQVLKQCTHCRQGILFSVANVVVLCVVDGVAVDDYDVVARAGKGVRVFVKAPHLLVAGVEIEPSKAVVVVVPLLSTFAISVCKFWLDRYPSYPLTPTQSSESSRSISSYWVCQLNVLNSAHNHVTAGVPRWFAHNFKLRPRLQSF